jgi:hypothetical protein
LRGLNSQSTYRAYSMPSMASGKVVSCIVVAVNIKTRLAKQRCLKGISRVSHQITFVLTRRENPVLLSLSTHWFRSQVQRPSARVEKLSTACVGNKFAVDHAPSMGFPMLDMPPSSGTEPRISARPLPVKR